MQNYNEKEIIIGIKEQDNSVLSYVYKKFFKEIKYFIIRNSGNEDDAKDIFQEALIVIYKQTKEENLELTCGFYTYLYSVSRFIWLKQLKRKKIVLNDIYELGEATELQEDLLALFDDYEKYGLYQTHFKELGDDCKKILKLFFENYSLKEIAEIMGYKSENYAKKKKFYCKEFLVKSILNDPKYKELV